MDAGDHADEVILNINGGAPAVAEFGGPLSGEVHSPVTSSLSHFTRREGGEEKEIKEREREGESVERGGKYHSHIEKKIGRPVALRASAIGG